MPTRAARHARALRRGQLRKCHGEPDPARSPKAAAKCGSGSPTAMARPRSRSARRAWCRSTSQNREVAGTSRTLTFGGEPGAVIPRGAPFVSDDVALDLPDLARLKVEIFLPTQTGPCTCHLTGVDELAVSPPGNFVGKPFEPVSKAQYRAFLSGVEVDLPDALGTIVTYGDSITDGVGATAGANRRWPDILANRLQEAGREWAVANSGDQRQPRAQPRHGRKRARALRRGRAEPAEREVHDRVRGGERHRQPLRAAAPRWRTVSRHGPAADHRRADDRRLQATHRPRSRQRHQGDRQPDRPLQGRCATGPRKARPRARRINDWILSGGAFDGLVRLDTAFADPADPARCATAITWATTCTAATPG